MSCSSILFTGMTCEELCKKKLGASKHYPIHIKSRRCRCFKMWPDLIRKAKNGSFDVIQTYVFWNGHEPSLLARWTILEKHSCKASKLHLKPRRFKIFLETLENQLLKDRKKNIRKRPTQGGNSSTARQRRITGNTSTDAYKKWEKAAIAGVLLVADAAEHLERTSLDNLADGVQNVQGNKGSDPTVKSGANFKYPKENIFGFGTYEP